MEPSNQPMNQPQVQQAAPEPVVATVAQQATQPPQAPKSNKKLLYIVLLGVIVVLVVAAIGFYLMKAQKTTQKVVEVPAPTVVPTVTNAPEVVVNNASDLDGLLVGLAQADNSLDTDLTNLNKDSSF